MTARALHKANRARYRNTAAAEDALDALAQAGLGAWEDAGAGGRPSRAFRLAPEPPPEDADGGGEGGDL